MYSVRFIIIFFLLMNLRYGFRLRCIRHRQSFLGLIRRCCSCLRHSCCFLCCSLMMILGYSLKSFFHSLKNFLSLKCFCLLTKNFLSGKKAILSLLMG